MIRSEHSADESMHSVTPGTDPERTRGRSSTRLLLLAIAVLVVAPARASAQPTASRLGSAATVVTARPAAPLGTAQPAIAQPVTAVATTAAGSFPSGLSDSLVVAGTASFSPAPSCGPDTLAAVRAMGSDEVFVDCSLTLGRYETITRKIVFFGASASRATLQCDCDAIGNCTTLRGGIRFGVSETDGRPENITVRGCRITGDVRLESPDTCPQPRHECQFRPGGPPACLPLNVTPHLSCESTADCPCGHVCAVDRTSCADTKPGFPEWLRARAPRRITFDHVTIDGTGNNRFYVGWGATETKLINSMITGEAKAVPVYLAPHSSGTLIKNNQFHIDTVDHDRELIAIDGSEHNQIISNWFSGLDHGGIYLFRNCGERGTIRHTTPSFNEIVNNVFYYDSYSGPKPAVYLGSRDGNPPGFEIGSWGSYCDDDAGFPYGSSADDRDFATHNVVMQNEIRKRSLTDMIRSENWVNDAMNLIDRNQTVTDAAWPRPPAGCYVRGGYKEFIRHGETTDKFAGDDGAPACGKVTCVDGVLRPALVTAAFDVAPSGLATLRSDTTPRDPSVCNVQRVPIDCQVTGDNSGCHQTVYCPAGTKIVGAVAACNLEYGEVSDADLATVPPNLIYAARTSDRIQDGSCYVGNNIVVGEILGMSSVPPMPWIPQSAVQSPIRGIFGLDRVSVGCQERDKNGGDCHIRGSLYCAP